MKYKYFVAEFWSIQYLPYIYFSTFTPYSFTDIPTFYSYITSGLMIDGS